MAYKPAHLAFRKPKRYEKKVSKRMQAYVDELLISGDDVEAARRAGYSHPPQAAARLRKTKQVKELVASKQASIARSARMADVLTIDAKLTKLWDFVTRADADSDAAAVRNAISAIAEANRMQGHLAADKLVTVSMTADVDLKRGQEEIAKLISAAKIGY